ncbi:MAG: hypothetical protein ACXW2Q_12995 [Thermoanaerobaculia bacterium]
MAGRFPLCVARTGSLDVNAPSIALVLLAAAGVILLPRRWATLCLLTGTCYIPFYIGFEVGGFNFTAIRMLIAAGLVRMAARGEWPRGERSPLDVAMIAWTVWLLASSAFHDDPSAALKYRLGLAYDALGVFALGRALCRGLDDLVDLAKQMAIVLLPLALAMLYEKATAHNLFSVFGGVGEASMIREGNVRANGPFGHPILVGTVGAICLPLLIALRQTDARLAYVGIAACIAIIYSSASSGPILSALAGLFALAVWRYRAHVRTLQWLAVVGYIALDIVMKDPAYFIVARIDLAGGSTSWYRARLIQSALEHINEWWLAGTDYTRHWMWVVVSWSPNHTDITSEYIQMGVWGGLPLMALFVFALAKGFRAVTEVLKGPAAPQRRYAFFVWSLGSSLFALAITGFSVSYFDQSFTFLYLVLGTMGSAWSIALRSRRTQTFRRIVPRSNGLTLPVATRH